jgi:protein-tyrosine-phosphatase
MPMNTRPPRQVLFLSVRNSGRSQIAEALVNHFLGDEWQAHSAGTAPARQIHPLAVQVLKEWGVDTTPLRPKSVVDMTERRFDLVLVLSDEAEHAPHWPGPDPVRRVWLPEASRVSGSVVERIDAFRQARNVIWHSVREHLHAIPRRAAAAAAPS